jgi:hypothetical protein
MSDCFPPFRQRQALLIFAEACDTRSNALRRDERGDLAIWGNNGHVYAVPEGYQLMIGCDAGNHRWSSARGWESAKRRLGFGKVTQDGDGEGSIILGRLPSKAEPLPLANRGNQSACLWPSCTVRKCPDVAVLNSSECPCFNGLAQALSMTRLDSPGHHGLSISHGELSARP